MGRRTGSCGTQGAPRSFGTGGGVPRGSTVGKLRLSFRYIRKIPFYPAFLVQEDGGSGFSKKAYDMKN